VLGCPLESIITFLPDNFESAETPNDFVVRGEVTTIRKVLAAGGIATATLSAPSATPPGFIHNKSHDWAVPVIFVAAELVKTTPDLVAAVIDLIRDYAVSLFKGRGADKRVKIEIVVERERTRTYQKITYDGDVAGLESAIEMVGKAHGAE